MGKTKFSEIWKWGIITILTGVIGFAMQDLGLLGTPQKYYYLLYIGLAFFLSLAIVQLTLAITPKFIDKITHWTINPKTKNLHLYSGSIKNDIFTLKFVSTEWRYLFNESKVFINVPPLVHIPNNPNHSTQKLKWTRQDNLQALKIKRFIPYEVNFLKLDPEKNEFWIDNKDNEGFRFSSGVYGFEIQITSNIYGRFKIKDNIFLNEIGWKASFQSIFVIVDYKGSNSVLVKIAKKEEYEKHIWFKNFKAKDAEKTQN